MSERVLVVDDEVVLRNNLVRFLTRSGHEAEGAGSAEEALARLEQVDAAVVLTDLKMPGIGGLGLLKRLADERPDVHVLVMTAYASLESAIEALRTGAWDYLLKPLSLDEVERKVGRLLELRALESRTRRLTRELHRAHDVDGLVAESQGMRQVMGLVARAAGTRSAVLVEGESGTGKELIARALHDQSPWSARDFVPVNLAAQPRELVDAALFGHERGAYTGARGAREGVFRAARGGTVFLDEVAELPSEVQVKLLRVLESHEVLPLGADRPVPVDFRLVAATNRPLRDAVAAGTFREDLLYRIEVLRIEVPPLRERPMDLAPLVQHLLERHARRMGRPVPVVSSPAMRALQAHAWPGNVRELSNVLERAVLLCDEGRVGPEHLPFGGGRARSAGGSQQLKAVLETCERDHIEAVLARCEGNKQRAAEVLGVHLATLYRRIEKLGIG